MTYCKDHQTSYKVRLEELGIPEWRFYEAKARYAREQEKESQVGEWKKTHPDSRSMVHHTTEAEHVEAILKSRAKRKAAEKEPSSDQQK